MELKKHRSTSENELWDLSALYQDPEDFLRSIEKTLEDINLFKRKLRGEIGYFGRFYQSAL